MLMYVLSPKEQANLGVVVRHVHICTYLLDILYPTVKIKEQTCPLIMYTCWGDCQIIMLPSIACTCSYVKQLTM